MRFRTRTRRASCRKSMDSRSWRKLIHVGDRVNGSPDCSPFSVYPSEVQGTREFSALSRGLPRYTGQENGAFSTTSQAGALQTLWKKEGKRNTNETNEPFLPLLIPIIRSNELGDETRKRSGYLDIIISIVLFISLDIFYLLLIETSGDKWNFEDDEEKILLSFFQHWSQENLLILTDFRFVIKISILINCIWTIKYIYI